MKWNAALLSLQVTLVATVLLGAGGLALALWLARGRFRGKAVIETVVNLPLVLPPSVLGYYLLSGLGAAFAQILVNPPAGGFAKGVLESALARAFPGDRVVLRAGEYRLDGPVAFPRGGDEGRALQADSETWMQQEGVRKPAVLVATSTSNAVWGLPSSSVNVHVAVAVGEALTVLADR